MRGEQRGCATEAPAPTWGSRAHNSQDASNADVHHKTAARCRAPLLIYHEWHRMQTYVPSPAMRGATDSNSRHTVLMRSNSFSSVRLTAMVTTPGVALFDIERGQVELSTRARNPISTRQQSQHSGTLGAFKNSIFTTRSNGVMYSKARRGTRERGDAYSASGARCSCVIQARRDAK